MKSDLTGSLPSLEELKAAHRESGAVIRVPEHLVQTYLDAKRERQMVQKAEEEPKRRVLEALGRAEVGICDLGRLTYREQFRENVDVARLLKEHPELGAIIEPYRSKSSFRALRFKHRDTDERGGSGKCGPGR